MEGQAKDVAAFRIAGLESSIRSFPASSAYTLTYIIHLLFCLLSFVAVLSLLSLPRLHKVLIALVSLLFNQKNLVWTKPADHVETFSGDMSVTRAEWEALRNKRTILLGSASSTLPQNEHPRGDSACDRRHRKLCPLLIFTSALILRLAEPRRRWTSASTRRPRTSCRRWDSSMQCGTFAI